MRFLQSVRFQINFKRMLRIALLWAMVGAIDALFTNLLTKSGFLTTTPDYQFFEFLFFHVGIFAISGMFSGAILVFFFKKPFRRFTFFQNLLIQSFIIIFLNIILFFIIFSVINLLKVETTSPESTIWQSFTVLLFSPYWIKIIGLVLILIISTIIILNISNKYGPGMFLKYIFGHFHKPHQEERIFLFADMNHSTTIAEQIGHIEFHDLLRDFFRDFTDAILYTRGQVYQYVGDQVVITWTMKDGLRNFNCVRCYFTMKESLQKRAKFYEAKYGIIPKFKAGLHSGYVTTGEVGVIKKEIVYSGDVLNTTARMQDLCSEYKQNILISKHLLDQLNLPPDSFELNKIGDIDLRGKKERIRLYTFENEGN